MVHSHIFILIEMEGDCNNRSSLINLPYRTGIKTLTYRADIQKEAVKNQHCFFCNIVCSNQGLEDHLHNSDSCCKKYQDLTGSESVEAVLVIMMDCIFCDSRFQKLESHLMRNLQCLGSFETKFGVQGLK